MTTRAEIIKAIKAQSDAGYKLATILADAKSALGRKDFAAACKAAGMTVAYGSSYAQVGGDQAIKWAINNNIINFNIGTLRLLSGIPLETMKRAAKSGVLDGIKQNDAAALRRSLLGGSAPKPHGRSPRLVTDAWPAEWRAVADKLLKLNLAASALRGQIGATVSTMKQSGKMTDAQARKSLLRAIKDNTQNIGVNGTQETRTVNAGGLVVSMVPTDPKGCTITVEVKL